MNIESKVWDTTKTGTKIHAFGEDGTALCRSSIQHNAGSRMVTKSAAVKWAGNTRAVTICEICETCEGRFQASIDAEAVEPVTETPCCEHAGMHHGGRGCDLCACTTPRTPVKRALVKPEVAPEVIAAVHALRGFARGETGWAVRDAIKTLDNAGIFAAIDAVTKCTCPPDERRKSGTDNHYIECPEAPVAKCTCAATYLGHNFHTPGCALAPEPVTVIGEDDMRDVASRIRARSAARGDDGAAVRMRNARAEGGFGLGTGHLS